MGPGGAAQHGRPRAHVPAAACRSCPSTCASATSAGPSAPSPGEGYPAAHTGEQNRILRTALDLSVPVSLYPIKTPGER